MVKIKRIFLFVILVIDILYAKNNVYTEANISNGIIKIYLVNKNLFDITYSYNAKYSNLKAIDDIPLEGSLKAQTKKEITQFYIIKKKYKLKSKYSWIIGNKNSFHNNSYIYALPYKIGTTQTVTQGFNGYFSHKGNSLYAVDFGLKEGTKIYASRDGVVVKTVQKYNKHGENRTFAKFANFIIIKHNDGTYCKYAHLQKNGVKVKEGQFVKKGEFLGYSGNTGFTNGAHLHFVVFKTKNAKSRTSIPIKFISKNGIVIKPIRGKRYTAVNY